MFLIKLDLRRIIMKVSPRDSFIITENQHFMKLDYGKCKFHFK